MRGCCLTNLIVLGVTDSGEPPVLSDYCVQWGRYDYNIFFPCGDNNSVNGVFNSGAICGGVLDIPDYIAAGNLFRYVAAGGGNYYYIQVITPAANGLVPDFGYIEYDVFGNPSGPVPIGAIQETNCILNCFTATFDVDDVDVDGFTGLTYNDGVFVDVATPVPFSDPGHDAGVLSEIIGYLEPSATFVSSYVGNTVTVTITSIMLINSGLYGDLPNPTVPFNFAACP